MQSVQARQFTMDPAAANVGRLIRRAHLLVSPLAEIANVVFEHAIFSLRPAFELGAPPGLVSTGDVVV
jgi:hypothetical protein